MNNNGGAISFDAIINNTKFLNAFKEMEEAIKGFSEKAKEEPLTIQGIYNQLGETLKKSFASDNLKSIGQEIINVRGEFQALEISLNVMLGSKQKADALMAQVVEFATKTPFSLSDIGDAAKLMLNYGFSADTVIERLKTLGDIALGANVPIDDLVNTLGNINRNEGKASKEDLGSLAQKSIPIYQELSKVLNLSGASSDELQTKINNMADSGQIGLAQIDQAFKNLTTGPGMFTGMVDAQSKSIDALVSNLSESVNRVYNEIGKNNEGFISGTLQMGASLLEHYKAIADILQVLALSYGTAKAAMMLYNVIIGINEQLQLEAALAGRALSVSEGLAAIGAKTLSFAQLELNKTILANPYVLAATLLVGLGSALYLASKRTIEVKTAQELLNESTKEARDNYAAEREELMANISVLKDKDIADSDRLKAYNKINEISPDILKGIDFETAKTKDLTQEVNSFVAALEKKIALEGNYDATVKAIKQRNSLLDRKESLDQSIKSLKGQNIISGPDAKASVGGFAYDGFVKEREEVIKAINKANESIDALKVKGVEINNTNTEKDLLTKISDARKNLLSAIKIDNKSDETAMYARQLKDYKIQLSELKKAKKEANDNPPPLTTRGIEDIDKELNTLQKNRPKSATNAEEEKYQKKINELLKEREKLDGGSSNKGKTTTPPPPKPNTPPKVDAPYGSLEYWDQVIAKSTFIQNISTNENERIRQAAIEGDAIKKAYEIKKILEKELSKYAIKTYQEELDEKQKQYALYQKWVTYLGVGNEEDNKTLLKGKFGDLLDKGKSYKDYLEKEKKALETQFDADPTNKKVGDDLVSVSIQLDIATGKKTGIEVFREEILKVKNESTSLVEQLEKLGKLKDGIKGGNVGENEDKLKAVTEEENQLKEQLEKSLQDYLTSHEDYEAQKTRITIQHNDLRAQLEKDKTKLTADEYKKQLAIINEGEKKALSDSKKAEEDSKASYKALKDSLITIDRKYLKEKLAVEKSALDNMPEADKKDSKGNDTKEYLEKKIAVEKTKKALEDDLMKTLSKFASLGGQLGNAMAQMNGPLGETGKLLAGITQQSEGILAMFKDDRASKAERIQSGVSGFIALTSLIVSSANEREKAEEEYRKNALQFEQDYKVAINERIGKQTQSKDNGFTKDYVGKLKDGFKMYNDASAKYQESLGKLSEGKAKIGQRNAVDWGKVGNAAGAGALIGASIGTAAFPVVGTIIGAAIGGLIGLFGGKKKKDEFTGLLTEYPELIQTASNGQQVFNKELAQTLISNNQVDDATKQMLQSSIAWTDQMEKAKEQIKGVVVELAGGLADNLRDGLVNAFKDGTSAADAFGKSVSGVLEDMLSKLIFNQVFEKSFTDLQENLANELNSGGTGIESFGILLDNAEENSKVFYALLDAYSKVAETKGIKVFGKGDLKAESLTGAVKGVSEDTAGVLSGNMTQLRIVATNQLVSLRNIEGIAVQQLTIQAKFLPFLERIDRNLDKLNAEDKIIRVKGL